MNQSYYGIIYKATNLINNKVYIGQTTSSLEKRKNRHIKDALASKDHMIFHSAIRKYGSFVFYWELIEFCYDEDTLLNREIYWISWYNSFYSSSNGYNIHLGGKGGNTFRGFSDERRAILKEKFRVINIGKGKKENWFKDKTEEEIEKIKNKALETRRNKTKEEKEEIYRKSRETKALRYSLLTEEEKIAKKEKQIKKLSLARAKWTNEQKQKAKEKSDKTREVHKLEREKQGIEKKPSKLKGVSKYYGKTEEEILEIRQHYSKANSRKRVIPNRKYILNIPFIISLIINNPKIMQKEIVSILGICDATLRMAIKPLRWKQFVAETLANQSIDTNSEV